MRTPENTYYICLSYENEPRPCNPYDEAQEHLPAYFGGLFQTLDQHLGARGLTFYLTWKVDELPSYGSDVIAVSMGDEWCRVPAYAQRVLATFKCYGTRPGGLDWRLLTESPYLAALLLAKRVRTGWHRLPGVVRRYREQRERRGKSLPPIYDLPIGYSNQLDLPLQPIEERPIDFFFAGSIEHGGSHPVWKPQRWLRNPKSVSRENMVHQLKMLSEKYPDLRIELATASQFVANALYYGEASGDMLDAEAYSRRMMDTKVCLVPRGTSPETFRFFEALRYGCIPVIEPLPSRWFYDGSPAVVVHHWSELEDVVGRLLQNPVRMKEKHEEVLQWWEEVCSEEAVGAFMARKIDALSESEFAGG